MLRRAVRPRMTEPTLQQAKVAHRSGNLKRALQLSEEGLAQPGSEFSLADRHELWVVKSHCLSALGRWVEAVCALESADHEGHIDIETDARLAMHKGYLMGSLARYAECWSLLSQAERAARQLNHSTLLAEVLWRRGMVFIFVGEYTTSENCLRSALEIASAEKDRHMQGLAKAGLAKNLMYRKEHADAIRRFEEALAIFQELGVPLYCAIVQGELGTCYMHLGDLDKALELLQTTADISMTNGAIPNYQVSLADIGNVYLRRGEFLTAISYYQRALELARQLGDQLSIGKWLRNLAQAYSQLGNPALAQGFEGKAKLVSDRLAEERERAAQVTASLK